MSSIKSLISNLHLNLSGKNISKKIVVIESDDWGSIRVPSSKSIERLKNKGVDLNKNAYTRFDGLERNSDVELLLEILSRFKDCKGNHPVITANFVTCNPDFERIKKENFESYFNQSIISTFNDYQNSEKVLEHVKSGYSEKFFLPQFHGREHVNVEYWMSLLKSKDPLFRLAFDEGISGLSIEIVPYIYKNIQATYDTLNSEFSSQSLKEGLMIFQRIFGFNSHSFIPNNFILDDKLFPILEIEKITVIQGMKYLLSPKIDGQERSKKFRRNGYSTKYNQKNIVRNCSYEPTETGSDHLSTLKEIELAFLLKQPAVISTHRINYTSRISVKNRDKNLKDFELLIKKILIKWPDVEFHSTLDLAKIY